MYVKLDKKTKEIIPKGDICKVHLRYRKESPELVQVVSEIPSRAFVTAAVWCVPFSGTVGLFNRLQTQKKSGKSAEVYRGTGGG